MNWDLLHRAADGIELVGFLVLIWKGNRAVNRILDVLALFPPHLHVNGRVVYPKGMEPGETHDIGTNSLVGRTS